MLIKYVLVNSFLIHLPVIMANKTNAPKYDRGRTIKYDHVPDDVYRAIIEKQTEIKLKRNRAKVSMSEAITYLIRQSIPPKL